MTGHTDYKGIDESRSQRMANEIHMFDDCCLEDGMGAMNLVEISSAHVQGLDIVPLCWLVLG